MPISRLDKIYRKVLLTKFFTKGWGKSDDIIRLFKFRKNVANRTTCYSLVERDHPIKILNEQTWSDCHVIEGTFRSPFAIHCPELVPPDVQNAFFQMVLPLKWPKDSYKPMCIHLAGTGDHYYWRRRNLMAKPLLKNGIGAIILENPYYGLRKPKEQIRSSLLNVSDIFVMGGCLILECMVLLNFCEQNDYWPLGVTGLSMGGHMASLAASCWPKPVVLVPCLSWSTASSVFTEGVMSEAIDWDCLQAQYIERSELYDNLAKCCRIIDNPSSLLCKNNIENSSSEGVVQNVTFGSISPYDLLTILKSSSNCTEFSCNDVNVMKGMLENKRIDQTVVNSVTKWFNSINRGMEAIKRRDKEAVLFMKGLMDEFTHLSNYPIPYDPSLITAVCAESDAYVPRQGCRRLEDLWPGSSVRYLNAGHVSAYIWHRKVFRNSIVEAFNRAKNKYPQLVTANCV